MRSDTIRAFNLPITQSGPSSITLYPPRILSSRFQITLASSQGNQKAKKLKSMVLTEGTVITAKLSCQMLLQLLV